MIGAISIAMTGESRSSLAQKVWMPIRASPISVAKPDTSSSATKAQPSQGLVSAVSKTPWIIVSLPMKPGIGGNPASASRHSAKHAASRAGPAAMAGPSGPSSSDGRSRLAP